MNDDELKTLLKDAIFWVIAAVILIGAAKFILF